MKKTTDVSRRGARDLAREKTLRLDTGRWWRASLAAMLPLMLLLASSCLPQSPTKTSGGGRTITVYGFRL